MSSVNKAIIVGRLGADPKTKTTQSGAVCCEFNVATDEKYLDKDQRQQERTEWHKVAVWNKLAEICQKYLSKGSLVYVEGQIQTDKWTDRRDVTHYTTRIVGRSVQFLSKAAPAASSAATFDDDDVPF
jgi:single-strand DNA-binding protein